MHANQDQTKTGVPAERLATVAIGGYVAYILIVGLVGNGRHFLELGVMRLVLFGALLAFARWSRALEGRLGRFGTRLAGIASVAYVTGASGAVITDGWSRNIFAAGEKGEPPWYAYVLGLSGILFALGTVLVGFAGRSFGWLAIAVLVAGASFPLVFALGDTAGHVAWFVPWLVFSVGLIRARSQRAVHNPPPAMVG